jgi:hypothetical protein
MKVPPITLSKSFALPLFTTLICLACLTSSTVTAEHPPAKAEAGFTLLFNGKDMKGWTIHGGQAGWSVKPGGILRNDASVGNHNWIYYDQKSDAPWATGVEVQISNAPRDNSHCTGSLYGLAAVDPRPDERADLWHSYEIHCVGTRYTVIADGITCVKSTDAHKALLARPLEGYIGLQDAHQKAPSYIEYRNIRIKELKSN